MTDDELKNMIKSHEGFRPYVYYDKLGYPTGGYGHAFLDRSPISHAVAKLLFEEDFERAKKGYERLRLDLDPVRRGVIIDMIYQMGLHGVRGFTKMLKALRKKDFETAAKEGLDSLWAKQTKVRAHELMGILKTGKILNF